MLTVSRDWINLFEGHFLTKTQVGHEAEVRTCELLCYAMGRHREVVLRFVFLSQEPRVHLPVFLFFFIMTSLHGSVL